MKLSNRSIARPRAEIWFAVMLVITVVAAFFIGRQVERSRPSQPQSLAAALTAFHAGYDQTALALLTPLAKEGNAKAQYWLADIYQHGLGVKPNIAQSIDLLEKSAAQGFVPAEARLGEIYLRGDQTLQDFRKARLLLHQAAIAGDSTAQRELGDIFALGLGVPRDRARAYGWYENALIDGDRLAERLRDDLVPQMTPEEASRGTEIAKDIEGQTKSVRSQTKPAQS